MKPISAAASRYVPVVFLILLIAGAWIAPIDTSAGGSVDSGLKRAFTTFAVARSLNAAISVAQSAEVSGGPIFVSGTISPGEALDPANDLVEQFGDLMLLATVSFGIQKVLIAIGSHDAVKLMLTILGFACVAAYTFGKRPARWLAILMIIALMVRFAIPVAVVGSEMMFDVFLEESYQESRTEIGKSDEWTEQTKDEDSWWRRFGQKDKESGKGEAKNSPDDNDNTGHAIEEKAEYVVQLIVIFVMQTIIFPLFILWALYAVARVLVSPSRERPYASRT